MDRTQAVHDRGCGGLLFGILLDVGVGAVPGAVVDGPDLVRLFYACQRSWAKFMDVTATKFSRLFLCQGTFHHFHGDLF